LTARELIAAIATVDRKDLPALLAAIAARMAEPERAPENNHTDNGVLAERRAFRFCAYPDIAGRTEAEKSA
jgi:hypothetical protein